MSSQILAERKRYYEVLQKVQHSSGDITEWLDWFLHCLKNAMLATENTTQKILRKVGFWKLCEHTPINERQCLTNSLTVLKENYKPQNELKLPKPLPTPPYGI